MTSRSEPIVFHRIEHDGNSSIVWTRGDPSRTGVAMRYIVNSYPDEPMFCIRGRDKLAIATATYYAGLARINLPAIGRAQVLDAVTADVAAFQRWQRANAVLLKYPDR